MNIWTKKYERNEWINTISRCLCGLTILARPLGATPVTLFLWREGRCVKTFTKWIFVPKLLNNCSWFFGKWWWTRIRTRMGKKTSWKLSRSLQGFLALAKCLIDVWVFVWNFFYLKNTFVMFEIVTFCAQDMHWKECCESVS